MLPRKQNWVELLDKHLAEAKDTPFTLGTHDCLLHVANAVHAMTGTDPAAEFRGTYTTELGFMRHVVGAGCCTLEEFIETLTHKHEMKEVPVPFAQRGDIVLFDSPEGDAFGIVHLNGIDSVCVGPDGFRRVPTLTARRAWRVGYWQR